VTKRPRRRCHLIYRWVNSGRISAEFQTNQFLIRLTASPVALRLCLQRSRLLLPAISPKPTSWWPLVDHQPGHSCSASNPFCSPSVGTYSTPPAAAAQGTRVARRESRGARGISPKARGAASCRAGGAAPRRALAGQAAHPSPLPTRPSWLRRKAIGDGPRVLLARGAGRRGGAAGCTCFAPIPTGKLPASIEFIH
jgi:hypothetical protein